MSNTRILYVASEINPFLELSNVADFVRKLPQVMQEKGMEIRILVPRFGLINERRNRLHEVVRLSGVNIDIADEERPLIIKVASIPNAKLQVYFIDNDDYFRRKHVFHDKNDEFYEDNDERAIFFCKGVLETVKQLGWAPDIVHCNDWMTGLIPLYLKTDYKNDPLFEKAKCIFSIYGNKFDDKFNKDIVSKAITSGANAEMLKGLSSADYHGFLQIGTEYADVVINSTEEADEKIKALCDEAAKDRTVNTISVSEESLETYFDLYTDLVK